MREALGAPPFMKSRFIFYRPFLATRKMILKGVLRVFEKTLPEAQRTYDELMADIIVAPPGDQICN